MENEARRIVITGATGFLGGWLVASCIERGYSVFTIVKSEHSKNRATTSQYYLRGLDRQVDERVVDLYDPAAVADFLGEVQPDAVIHLAAVSDVTVSASNPILGFSTSASSTINLLEAIRTRSEKTLFVSHTTDKVYSGNAIPFREEMPLMPTHIYEVAKVTQEHLTRCYAEQYGVKTVTVRCGNYFGGYDFNFERIIPGTIRQCVRGEPIEVRSSGEFTRDFIYIEDAVEVNHLLLDRYFSDQPIRFGGAYNFSLEVNISVLQLIDKICLLMESKPGVDVLNKVKQEIPDMQLSASRARDELGWKPLFTLEEGLSKTIDFYREHLISTRGAA